MTPGITFDPRDPWARARRIEIFRYAQEKGVTEVVEQMPKDVMVKRLKAKGIPPPPVPPRSIGAHINPRSGDTSPTSHRYTGQTQPKAETVVEVDADEVLERDWQQQSSAPKTDRPMTITEARQECKRRGIKMKRTDNLVTLKAKLDGNKNAA